MARTSGYEPVEVGDTTFHELVAGGPELAARIERAAAHLAARGFGKGDVLAIKAPNSESWAEAALAAMTLGGAVTGIGATATDEEVERQLADSRAALLIDRFDELEPAG